MEITINGARVKTNTLKPLGKGGEADIFHLGNGKALKLFKSATHPDYEGDQREQRGAVERLRVHQTKLRQFPKGLPSRVVTPETLALDQNGQVVGYAMPEVRQAEPLLRFSEKSFRTGLIPADTVMEIFRDLHTTVTGIHRAGVVIGDFNDLNGLVVGKTVYLIDADSFQFGKFFCMTFTQKFVDPLLCDPKATDLMLLKPHQQNSDWYAYAILLMQSLLYVGPYGGIYKPAKGKSKVSHGARPLHRLTVFDPEVVYPKPAIPWQALDDGLLQYFYQVFQKDARGEFPRRLLETLVWKTCKKCGLEFSRERCPICEKAPVGLVAETVLNTVRGKVTATVIATTNGPIVYAAIQNGKLLYVAHENGVFRREDRSVVYQGQLQANMRFRLQGEQTLIGEGENLLVLEKNGTVKERVAVDLNGQVPMFDSNTQHRYWIRSGRLVREGDFGTTEFIGEVLESHTLFWVGPTFGFGFYWAGMVRVGFVFDVNHRGINDTVKLPPMRGQLIDTRCFFAKDRAWFIWISNESGVRKNHCTVIGRDGAILASQEADDGDGSWLGTIGAKCAVGDILLAATDEGIVKVKAETGRLVEAEKFPDTEPFVSSECSLLVGGDGLYVVTRNKIVRLVIGK